MTQGISGQLLHYRKHHGHHDRRHDERSGRALHRFEWRGRQQQPDLSRRFAHTLSVFRGSRLSDGTSLYVADGGNDRVLIYSTIPTANAVAADIVLGQTDFVTDAPTDGADTMNAPLSLAWDRRQLEPLRGGHLQPAHPGLYQVGAGPAIQRRVERRQPDHLRRRSRDHRRYRQVRRQGDHHPRQSTQHRDGDLTPIPSRAATIFPPSSMDWSR